MLTVLDFHMSLTHVRRGPFGSAMRDDEHLTRHRLERRAQVRADGPWADRQLRSAHRVRQETRLNAIDLEAMRSQQDRQRDVGEYRAMRVIVEITLRCVAEVRLN